MDIAPGIYNTGTATVDAGGLVVSFQGAPNLQAAIRHGDRFGGHVGLPIRIASVATDTVTLAHPWPGPAQTAAPYEISFTPYDLGYREEFGEIIKRYGRGALPAMAELVGVDKAVPMFTGPQTMTLLTQQDLTQGVRYDVQVATLIDRAAYDNSAEAFAVLVSDTGDGRAAIYSRVGAAGNWSEPAYITGPAVTLDITEVDPVPYGTPPDVTLTPVAGGYGMKFDIPLGMVIEPGTITTLPPDQPAAWDWVPIPGGYQVNLSVPRGPTGDIDGVSPFWVTRLGSDVDATAARAGLGATTVGDVLFTAVDAAAARVGLGATTVGSSLFTAADAAAARAAMGARSLYPGDVITSAISTRNDALLCNGAPVSRTTYAALFAAVGAYYGNGDGSTTFNVPDYRGLFLRGLDNGRGIDPGRTLYSRQGFAIQAHNHALGVFAGAGGAAAFSAAGGAPTTYYSTNSTGGSETRPENASVNYFIVF